MENENKIAKISILKEYFTNLLKQKNIKNIDFIMLFLIDSVAEKRGYATIQELYSMIDRYVYLESLPYNRQVELLDNFYTYKGIDLNKPLIIGGKEIDIKTLFNQVVDDIQKCNPNLLTIGYDAIKSDTDGIIELDKLYTAELEKKVEEGYNKHYSPYRIYFEINFPYDTKNVDNDISKITNSLLDTYNTRKKFFDCSDIKVIDEKTFLTALDYRRVLNKTERVIEELNKNPKASIKYIMQKTKATMSLVKKVSAEYRKNSKKVQ